MNSFWKNKKILITGSSGFIGKHLIRILSTSYKIELANLFLPRSKELDLRERKNCKKAVKNIDIVIHLAGLVGGIGFNRSHPGQMFFDNLSMGINLMEEARLAKVKKFVSIGTVCSYPKLSPIPFKEKDLWQGYPEETNAPYGLAKKMLLVQSQAYRQQYNFNGIFLLPVNTYGPGDNFDPNSSHVIPGLIKKFFDAKKARKKEVMLWGTGRPTREFLYVEDTCKAILLATEFYNSKDPVNIGSGFEISIKELAEKIRKATGFQGRIVWDKSKPDGQPRRMLDTTEAKKEFGFISTTPFDEGLDNTIRWYEQNYIKIE